MNSIIPLVALLLLTACDSNATYYPQPMPPCSTTGLSPADSAVVDSLCHHRPDPIHQTTPRGKQWPTK